MKLFFFIVIKQLQFQGSSYPICQRKIFHFPSRQRRMKVVIWQHSSCKLNEEEDPGCSYIVHVRSGTSVEPPNFHTETKWLPHMKNKSFSNQKWRWLVIYVKDFNTSAKDILGGLKSDTMQSFVVVRMRIEYCSAHAHRMSRVCNVKNVI